jgi:hypothetical protein
MIRSPTSCPLITLLIVTLACILARRGPDSSCRSRCHLALTYPGRGSDILYLGMRDLIGRSKRA